MNYKLLFVIVILVLFSGCISSTPTPSSNYASPNKASDPGLKSQTAVDLFSKIESVGIITSPVDLNGDKIRNGFKFEPLYNGGAIEYSGNVPVDINIWLLNFNGSEVGSKAFTKSALIYSGNGELPHLIVPFSYIKFPKVLVQTRMWIKFECTVHAPNGKDFVSNNNQLFILNPDGTTI